MKRLALSAIAAAMFALPAIEAHAAPRIATPVTQTNVEFVQQRYNSDKRVVKKKVVTRKVVRESRWKRGQRYSEWRRHQRVRDWNRYGLYRPARGQEWVRVGNDYLLVSVVSGVIAGLVVGR